MRCMQFMHHVGTRLGLWIDEKGRRFRTSTVEDIRRRRTGGDIHLTHDVAQAQRLGHNRFNFFERSTFGFRDIEVDENHGEEQRAGAKSKRDSDARARHHCG